MELGEVFGEKLVAPLIVAGLTGAFGWFFGPHLANGWQDRQHQFETRSALVQELSKASAELMSAVQTREFEDPKNDPRKADQAYLDAFRSWDEESQIIDAKIATYYKDGPQLAGRWRKFADEMRLYHNLADQQGPDGIPTIKRLAAYAAIEPPSAMLQSHRPKKSYESKRSDVAYQNAWVKLKQALIERRDDIVEQLLREKSVA